MTDEKLDASLSTNTIIGLTDQSLSTDQTYITSLTDKHYSLDSEDDFHSGCQNASHQQFSVSELPLPRRSHSTNGVKFLTRIFFLSIVDVVSHVGLYRQLFQRSD